MWKDHSAIIFTVKLSMENGLLKMKALCSIKHPEPLNSEHIVTSKGKSIIEYYIVWSKGKVSRARLHNNEICGSHSVDCEDF